MQIDDIMQQAKPLWFLQSDHFAGVESVDIIVKHDVGVKCVMMGCATS